MAIVLEGDGTISGVTTFTTPLDDISFDSINVTGIVTASTFQIGTGVSISSPRSQTLALFTNNAETFHIDDAGRVGIGTTNANKAADTNNTSIVNAGIITANTLYDNYIKHPSDTFAITTNSNERLRIINDGRVLINHTSSTSTGGLSAYLQINGTTAGTSSAALIRNSDNNDGPFLSLAKTRGAAQGSTTVVQDGDSLGSIRFSGADGSDLQSWGAQIKAEVDGTPGANDMPCALVFGTTSDGANGTTERTRISSAGKVLIGSDTLRNIGGSGSNGQVQIEGTSTNLSSLAIINNQNNANAPYFNFGKTRGTSTGAVTTVADGDNLGMIRWSGADGTDLENSTALIKAVVNGSVSGNTIPTDIVFQTSATSGSAKAERMRITSAGSVGIGTDAPATELHVMNSTLDCDLTLQAIAASHDARINLYAHSTGVSQIRFGDESDTNIGLLTYTHSDNSLAFRTNDAERVRIDSSGRLLVGATAAMTTGSSDHRDTIQATDAAGAQLLLARNDTGVSVSNRMGEIAALGNDTNSNGYKVGGSIRFEADAAWGEDDFPTAIAFKTCANASATLTERVRINNVGKVSIGTAAVADQSLVSYGGLDVSARGKAGQCSLCVGADHSTSDSQTRANNDQKDCRIGMPHYTNAEEPLTLINGFSSDTSNDVRIGGGSSYLNAATKVSIFTAANQTTVSGTEVLRCNANQDVVAVSGDLIFETAGKGVVLGATSNVGNSNTLDDYEEGTFTPTYGPSITATYDQQHGDYVKIGKLVTCWVRLRTDSVSGGNDSNNLRIDGLPFTQVTNSNTGGGHIIYSAYWLADKAPKIGHIVSNTTYMNLYNFSAADEDASILKTDALNTGANDNDSRWVITYYTAT